MWNIFYGLGISIVTKQFNKSLDWLASLSLVQIYIYKDQLFM